MGAQLKRARNHISRGGNYFGCRESQAAFCSETQKAQPGACTSWGKSWLLGGGITPGHHPGMSPSRAPRRVLEAPAEGSPLPSASTVGPETSTCAPRGSPNLQLWGSCLAPIRLASRAVPFHLLVVGAFPQRARSWIIFPNIPKYVP